MTEEDLLKGEAIEQAAGAGPWFHLDGRIWAKDPQTGRMVADFVPYQYDGEFIAHARTENPKLRAEVRRLQVEVARLKALLPSPEELEW